MIKKNSEHQITHKVENNHDILNDLLLGNFTSQTYYKNENEINIQDYQYDEYIKKYIDNYKINESNLVSNNIIEYDCACKVKPMCECGFSHIIKCTNCIIKKKLGLNKVTQNDTDNNNDDNNNNDDDFM